MFTQGTLLVPLLTSWAEPTADCWRAKCLWFLFLNEVFQKEGVCVTHMTLQVPFQKKNKNKWFVVLLSQAIMWCKCTNSPSKGTLMLVNPGPEREQAVPSTNELCVQERSCTSPSWWTQPPACPAKPPDCGRRGSSLSRHAAHAGHQGGGCSGTSWGEFGPHTGWGSLRGESPILFFQCSSQQEEQDRRFPPAPD